MPKIPDTTVAAVQRVGLRLSASERVSWLLDFAQADVKEAEEADAVALSQEVLAFAIASGGRISTEKGQLSLAEIDRSLALVRQGLSDLKADGPWILRTKSADLSFMTTRSAGQRVSGTLESVFLWAAHSLVSAEIASLGFCGHCGRAFVMNRASQRYCKTTCAQALYNQRYTESPSIGAGCGSSCSGA